MNAKIIGKIVEHFGELTVSRGTKTNLLEMEIDLLYNGKLSFFMKYYMKDQSHYPTKLYIQPCHNHQRKVYKI